MQKTAESKKKKTNIGPVRFLRANKYSHVDRKLATSSTRFHFPFTWAKPYIFNKMWLYCTPNCARQPNEEKKYARLKQNGVFFRHLFGRRITVIIFIHHLWYFSCGNGEWGVRTSYAFQQINLFAFFTTKVIRSKSNSRITIKYYTKLGLYHDNIFSKLLNFSLPCTKQQHISKRFDERTLQTFSGKMFAAQQKKKEENYYNEICLNKTQHIFENVIFWFVSHVMLSEFTHFGCAWIQNKPNTITK